jgi:uncharacterized protein (TIGR00369 family)
MARITLDEFRKIMETSLPIGLMLGAEPILIEERRAVFRLPFREDSLRPGGSIAGPMLMGLADVVIYAAILGTVEGALQAVTSNLTMNFLRRVPPGPIIAEGRLLRVGRRLAFGEVELFAEGDPEMVAHATLTYALPAPAT